MRIQAKNFQSWSDLNLNVEGFTAIVGPSNLGKSAVFRVLKGVFRNDISSNHIKNGEKETNIKVEVNGSVVEASRSGKGSVTYIINGSEYSKLAGKTPEAVASLGYSPIQLGSLELDPIFGGQFDTQFLLNSSPAELNTVLGAFSSTEKLDQGKKKILSRIKELDSEAKIIGGLINESESKIHNMETTYVDAFKLDQDILDKNLETTRLELSIQAIDSFDNSLNKYTILKSISDYLDNLDLGSAVSGVQTNISKIDSLSDYRISKYYLTLYNNMLVVVDSLYSVVEDINIKMKCIKSIEFLLKPVIKLPPNLNFNIDDIEDQVTSILLIENILGYKKALSSLESELTDIEKKKEIIEENIILLKKEIEKEEMELIKCPKCGHRFDKDETCQDH